MVDAVKLVVLSLVVVAVGSVAWVLLGMWVKTRWPARIPDDLRFERELASDLKLRAIAELLAERFKDYEGRDVVCLGPVRGKAARVLFHAGRKNPGRNRNIHRNDYVLHVERLGKARVKLRLDTNQPYSYFRIERREVEALKRALDGAYGNLRTL